MSDQLTCETNLSECPYCGTAAELLEGVSNVMGKTYQDWTVCCSTPRCYGNTAYHWHPTAEDARLAWNTRNGQLQTDIGARKES